MPAHNLKFLGNNRHQWSLVYRAINKFTEMLQFAHYARPNLVLATLRNPRRKIKKFLVLCEFQFHKKKKFKNKNHLKFLGNNNILQWRLVFLVINKFIEILQFVQCVKPNLVHEIPRKQRIRKNEILKKLQRKVWFEVVLLFLFLKD